MLRIGICDDEQNIVEQLRDMIIKIFFSHTEVEITCFTDGGEVIEAINNGGFFVDLLFLDIHMKHVNGLKTAQFIRRSGMETDIIFLTASKEHVFEGYTYKAFAYHLKPIKKKLLTKDLLRYLEEKRYCEDSISVNTKGKELKLSLNRIIYFKSDDRRVTARMISGEAIFYAKLSDIEQLVKNSGFIRCHQSYIINRSMLEEVGRTECKVFGISVPISRRYYERMKENATETVFTHSLTVNQDKTGAIVFIKGKMLGAIIRIQGDEEIRVGRDGNLSDLVVNYPVISRLHCTITYNSEFGDYTVCDFSTNGLYKEDGEKLPKEQKIKLARGSCLQLGNDENVIRLG